MKNQYKQKKGSTNGHCPNNNKKSRDKRKKRNVVETRTQGEEIERQVFYEVRTKLVFINK